MEGQIDIHNYRKRLNTSISWIESKAKLTPDNRTILLKWHHSLVADGLTVPRIEKLISNAARIGEWLGKDFVKAGLVRKTKSVPAHFFIENPLKELNYFLTQYLKKQTKLIEEKKAAIKEIINHKNDEFNEHWEIKAKQDSITIIDRKENKALSDKFEARQVKETIEKFIKSLPEENKYLLAYARRR